MATSNKPARSLIGALEDHSDEGIGILTATPARLASSPTLSSWGTCRAWCFFGMAGLTSS